MKILALLCICIAPASACIAQGCPNYNATLVMQYAHKNPFLDLVLVSAHRGVYERVPENSPAAVQAAKDACIEISEIDARLTIDGQPAMIHDGLIARTTTGVGLIYDIPYSVWKTLKLRDRFGNPTSISAPSLTDFINQLKSDPKEVLVLDCKDSLTLGSHSPNLQTSIQVLRVVYGQIVQYENANGLGASLRDRIVFKVRFPEMTAQSQGPVDFLHYLGINDCDSNPSAACSHLNLVPIMVRE